MLQIQNVHKVYKVGNIVQKALDDVSLNLRDSEFVAILGPSGSGKTTLLNIIGGLDNYSDGDLIINGISTKKYKDRDWDSYRNHTVGFVFQSYNLIPHQTVLANVELALTISGISKSERKVRALDALQAVGLAGHEYKRPNQMSGGQMQRVAIARALVNDPDVLLADEPTGALDTETSVQVMDLLKEVAADRLVVMVTHNPELAQEYATRIVTLRDGAIQSDTDPFEVTELATSRHENMGKSSMSYLTSLALSFNNLRTKKARTFLTSFAGSIGIIGIALILSLSTGVNMYIKQIEEDTLTQYPVQINSSGFDFTSLLGDVKEEVSKTTESENEVYVAQMLTSMFSKIGSNDLASLKKYIDTGDSKLKENANAIEYTYPVEPQLFSVKKDVVRQVHPDTSFSQLGFGGAGMSSMIPVPMGTNNFYQLPMSPNLYETQYDVKAGAWPQKYNEVVLVLAPGGKISDFMLYSLGLRDGAELDSMVEKFSKEEDIVVPEGKDTYTFDELLATEFKLINPTDYYEYDKTYNVYKDKLDDRTFMKNLAAKGDTVRIVGIVEPVEDTNSMMLQPGVAYTSALTTHVIENAKTSEIVKKQLDKPSINVFTGKDFKNTENNAFDMQSLITMDASIMEQAFSFDTSKIAMGDIDLSAIDMDLSSLPQVDIAAILADLDIEITQEQIDTLVEALTKSLTDYLTENNILVPTTEDLLAFLQSDAGQAVLQKEVGKLLQEVNIVGQFQTALQKQIETIMLSATSTLSKALEVELSKQFADLGSSMQDAFSIDTNMFASSIKLNMDEKELSELMLSMMSKDFASYDGNLKKLGYANFSKPDGIHIYPKDFESKQTVIDILDAYNTKVEKTDPDKKIMYADPVGMLMSSVTDIINVITYVLIAFVAISLVVSSIMIGVITYISVLERKKEIGILRAIGASKQNISQVFNAETFIIGLFSGLLGIGITLLILIPGNMLIHYIAGNPSINARLPITGAIVLVVLSVILTLLGGLIPSRKAAQEDPVTALRTE